MSQPGNLNNIVPPGDDWIAREIREIRQQIAQMQGARSLESAEIGQGGIKVKDSGQISFLDTSGNALITLDQNGLTASPNGKVSIDGTLAVTGDALFEGNLAVPNGSITNDALANPLTMKASCGDTNSADLTSAGVFLGTSTVTVPDGFTSAILTVNANVGVSRNAGTGGYPFYMAAWIGGPTRTTWTGSAQIAATCADGSSMSIAAAWTRGLTGLTAGTVIEGGAWGVIDSGVTGWGAGSANGHSVMTAIFLR